MSEANSPAPVAPAASLAPAVSGNTLGGRRTGGLAAGLPDDREDRPNTGAAEGVTDGPTDRFIDDLGAGDYAALSPLVRMLLTADGTVTELLAAFYGEVVVVDVVHQGPVMHVPDQFPALSAPAGEAALDRVIRLVGVDSGRTYMGAASRILPDRLSVGLKAGLLAGREPLGRLLTRHRLETFREVVARGRCALDRVPTALRLGAEALGSAADTPGRSADPSSDADANVPGAHLPDVHMPVVWRSYRVIAGGHPVMVIGEVFSERLG